MPWQVATSSTYMLSLNNEFFFSVEDFTDEVLRFTDEVLRLHRKTPAFGPKPKSTNELPHI